MLTPDILKVAIVMIGRATCKGDEATDVAITLQALKHEFDRLSAQEPEDPNGNDA